MINLVLKRSPKFGTSLKVIAKPIYSTALQRSLILSTTNKTYYSTFHSNANSKKGNQDKKIPLWTRIKSFSTFTASGALVIGATGISTVVIYLILTELFSPSGDTQLFNRAVTLVEKDEIVRTLLQCDDTDNKKERLKAYGELYADDKWTRNRPIASNKRIDKNGKEHYLMRFHVESKQKMGLVHIEAVESEKRYQPDFVSVYIDIPGEKRYYLIKPKINRIVRPKGFLGINWGPRKQ
ncbi:hypothetical protein Kpol_499p11 [Vanderwaltozyma polyspora DSM 70294]|uniref:Mitochondrial import inner membrane translocase subunit Tim21 n=1 Tax=Vanderwaltozyma polyspora (strain ATCC 22028 / DSM 70294 / BCRC 21397 / CBS 2163 / NBRC 10782 / NRRL Y-8283 / UCD 57-17) TaxID=436907 RepID=A7TP14_VANPO|nr:uncharacterized protein Kpol_499p11 [Vanderwaltozyma polyspora DSM 70294]EDO15983.1 hypothetical protein Kpol_499p11 [Vanderwaltozyma polyspora DSM 70294]